MGSGKQATFWQEFFFFLINLIGEKLLYNIVMVMNQSWVHMSPHPECPSHLPPHPIPLGCLRAPALSASCIELALVIYFTYDNIHVSVLFSQIIPPCLLPQSPKVCFLHLCLFCCLADRVVVTIFLNSLCMCFIFVFLFLTYFSLYNRLQFHSPH